MAHWWALGGRLALLLAVLVVGSWGNPPARPVNEQGWFVDALPQAFGRQPVEDTYRAGAVSLLSGDLAPLPVPYYSQRDQRWGCAQLGTCKCDLNGCTTQAYTTMADAGCYPTSQAMIFAYYAGGSYLDPGAYNQCLLASQGYTAFPGACSNGVCGALDDAPAACRPSGLQYLGPSIDKAILDEDLRNGHPAIAVVGAGVPGRLPHAVVVIGKRGPNYVVNDPYYDAASYDRVEISPAEIYGFHRWTGPVPVSVSQALPQTGASVPAQAAPVQVIPRPFAGEVELSSAPSAIPAWRATYTRDVTVPDGTTLPTGRAFAKAWAIVNSGQVSWPDGTRLKHVGGALLGAEASVAVPSVRPGQAAVVWVPMRSPASPGPVQSDWRLEAPDGTAFGPTLYVQIDVEARRSRYQPNWSLFESARRRASS